MVSKNYHRTKAQSSPKKIYFFNLNGSVVEMAVQCKPAIGHP